VKTALREGLIVAIAGAVLAFAANSLSPRGLKLTTDFFPSDRFPTNSAAATNSAATAAATNPAATTNLARVPETNVLAILKAELLAKGMRLADSNQVAQLFRDPRYDMGLLAFVDARTDDEYQAGHIPGAYQLDHYRPEKYLPAVLQACNLAQEIIVYCNGGECIDSKETAFLLRQTVPKEKLLVYLGGLHEWATNQMPVEIGDRKSGRLRGTNAPSQPINPK
jgi:rhodanese-related sulfurtransferase